MISSFFNPDDGLTVQAFVVEDSQHLTGYLDILDAEFFLNDDPATTRAEFVCEAEYVTRAIVGKTVKVQGVNYRVNQLKPDGAGVVTLALLSTE